MIELISVTKIYKMGDELLKALEDVNLSIKDGEFIAIMGPSGSGKSTLANIIGGLDTPTQGKIVVDDEDLSKTNDNLLSAYRNRRIGFVFQTFNLQPHLTALENVVLPLIFTKMNPKNRIAKAKECLTSVGLADRMKHKPTELSGGQRQRVSIARALANDPQIIIADEPTGNLDSKKSAEIIGLLRKLNREKKMTLIVITHDMTIAKQAGRIVTIHDGKVGR